MHVYTSDCNTVLVVRKFIAYESSRTLERKLYAYKHFCEYSNVFLILDCRDPTDFRLHLDLGFEFFKPD